MEHPLPTDPRTGLPALGWRKARTGEDGPQPIWPILGGSGEGEEGAGSEAGEAGDGEAAEAGDASTEGEAELGDAGRRALDRLRADLREEKTRRKAAEADLAAATAASQGKQGSEETPSVEQLREQALAQARAETLHERALDRLEARAKKFHDSADARAFLASHVGDFVDGTKIDDAAIDEALAELLTARPYLGTQPATGRPEFKGTGDGGARKGSEGAKQLGKADIARMSPEAIVAAQKAGQLDEYLASET
jgi:hypothetical protein